MSALEYSDSYDEETDSSCLSTEAADQYANDVASLAIKEYIKQKENTMSKIDLETTVDDVLTETQTNAAILSGEILLDNFQTIAEKMVFSRMSWYKKLMMSDKNKELAITAAMYFLVHAAKTGGFGLTKYRVNHKAIEFVSLACNARIMKYAVKSLGVNTNVAEMLFTAPTITEV